ncbi:MAG: PilZ domain-containing protein [Candidatus Omnitrophica bacterium]|nr:PilZ domain-containing protein [Candidatus Omnitrophota bacterium]MBU1925273.1 PilZ domain-containing protein [Candidatus Omnitrophota bacterium]
MKDEDKRRYARLGAFLEGAFETENGLHGLVMLTNFSREGFRAYLNRRIDAGCLIKLEIWLPGSIVPVFISGKVIWLKKSAYDWTYHFEAGLKNEEMDVDDRHRMMEYVYEHWRSARVRR